MVKLEIDKCANGYTVFEKGSDDTAADIWIAATQDAVAGVVKTIIRGAFGDDKKKPTGKGEPNAD